MGDADQLAQFLPFWAMLSPSSRQLLARQVRVVSLPPGRLLLSQGDEVSGIYFIGRGSARVYYLDAEGREGTLYRVVPGESCLLALNSMFSHIVYPAFAEAGEAGAEVAVIDGATARALMASDEAFQKAVFGQLADRLFAVLASLEAALRLTLDARLCGLLLDLADASGEVRLPQERLAAHLGSSREVVSRVLRELSAAKLVETGYGRVRLRDRAALAERAGT